MKRKMLKFMVVIFTGITFLVGLTLIAYAHDPSATTQPGLPHIHIKGRVTNHDGIPIAGAGVGATDANLVLAPSGCIASWSGSTETGSDGRYELIFYLQTATPTCRDAFDRFTVDKNRMRVTREGYDIRPR